MSPPHESRAQNQAQNQVQNQVQNQAQVTIALCVPSAFRAADEAALRTLLAPEELARRARFLRPHLQHDFTIARALVRLTLGRACGVPPRDLRFALHPHGRPYLQGSPLHFNLSHTHDLIALAWSRSHNIGVDVEAIRARDVMGIMDRYFAPAEVTHIRALSEDEAVSAFYRTWTLKESYIKARGLGLALPLDGFAFRLDPPSVSFDRAKIDDEGERWWFRALALGEAHRGALAVESPTPVEVRVQRRSPAELLADLSLG